MAGGTDVKEGAGSSLVATVSLARKIGLPGYGNAECFLSLSGITTETTEADIDVMLDQASIGWKKIAERVNEKAKEIIRTQEV